VTPFKRILSSAGFAAILLLVVAAPVGAGRSWCRADPIVRLGGTEYQIIISVPEENLKQIDGALRFEIYSPVGTEQELLFVDSGFNGHGEEVAFKETSSIATHMFYLDVPQNDRDFLVLMDVFVDGKLISTARGTSMEMIVPIPIYGR
jgi:hypothetical protein